MHSPGGIACRVPTSAAVSLVDLAGQRVRVHGILALGHSLADQALHGSDCVAACVAQHHWPTGAASAAACSSRRMWAQQNCWEALA